MDEIACLRKILLEKGVMEGRQSWFDMGVALREPGGVLGLLHVSYCFRREEFSLWQEDLRTWVIQE